VQSDTDVPHAESEILRLAEAGQDLVVVATNETELAPVAARFPDTHFVLFQDEIAGDNITNVEFADQESAFLAGAAAALVSKTGHVGFIGGVNTPVLLRFEAGFVAGAEAVDPGVRVDVVYASTLPNYDGFVQSRLTERAARPLLAAGADVLYVPAGAAQFGAFQAVIDMSEKTGGHLWAIGADEDAFVADGWQRTGKSKNHILTSTIKRFDIAAYDAVHDHLDGGLKPGSRVYDIANGGLELADSGGFLTAHATRLGELRQRIVAGSVVVPCVPDELDSETAAAAAEGPNCP
jgi:basic membrane protein A